MLLLIDSAAHLLVDAACAATLFGRLRGENAFPCLVLLYNTLAFSTQCLAGLAADRLRRHVPAVCAAMLAVAAGWALPLPAWPRVCLFGLGNSVFHVAAGVLTLERSDGRAGPLGVFVAPGAIGLALGTLLPEFGAAYAALLALCAAAVPFAAAREPVSARGTKAGGGEAGTLLPVLLALAVAVRAVGGTAVSFPWKSGAVPAMLTAAFVFAGKTAGGFACDRLGARRTALISVPAAALLIAFCASWMLPSLLGQLALNLTMPVTLWLLYRALPDEPGFSFGLAASALWPGTLAGQLMRLTGPALWLCVLLSFLFGLWAILYAEKRLLEPKGRRML